jgi:hypothetical protein
MKIYKQFYKYVPVNEMTGLQWFALAPAYGKEYGEIQRVYEFKNGARLLDIGDGRVREMIEKTIDDLGGDVSILDPNEQYSGGHGNKRYHELVKKYFGDEYDGTIIDENNLKSGDKYTAEDLEGPTEVVIWGNFDELLREVNAGGTGPSRRRRKLGTRKLGTRKLGTRKLGTRKLGTRKLGTRKLGTRRGRRRIKYNVNI